MTQVEKKSSILNYQRTKGTSLLHALISKERKKGANCPRKPRVKANLKSGEKAKARRNIHRQKKKRVTKKKCLKL